MLRNDQKLIADLVPAGSKILEIGCNEGQLLCYLRDYKNVTGAGLELRQAGVNACVQQGLSVVQGDADVDLIDYPNQAFDVVILSHALQAMKNPLFVFKQMLRVGGQVIVAFPNFAHWRIRGHLLLKGRMPSSKTLPYQWYDTPNIHLCTWRDFIDLCKQEQVEIVQQLALNSAGQALPRGMPTVLNNWLAAQAVFMCCKA